MPMSRDEIFSKVQTVLDDALGVDEEEVTPQATLSGDLGAESIDYLDIQFRVEKEFGMKIPKGELFPENVGELLKDPNYVQNNKVTPTGLAEMKRQMPHVDFTSVEADPDINKMGNLMTVNAIVNYVDRKLNGAGAPAVA
jgi:acyl carrier protein